MDGKKVCEKAARDDVMKTNSSETSEKLWGLLKQIPAGKVTTYKILAKKLGIHPRAVGRMLNSNPNPVAVPCHRVVMSDGKIGGYAFGAKKKVEILEREGVKVAEGAVDLSECLFE